MFMDLEPVLSQDKVTLTAGPLLVGYMLNMALYGVLSVQVYMYYIAFPKDRTYNKILVYGLYTLETVQSIFIGHDIFVTFVIGFGNFSMLTRLHYAWLTLPIMGGFAAFVVQCFYAYRIMILSKSKLVAGLIAVLSVIQYAGAFMDGILSREADNILLLTTPLQMVGHILWDGSSAVCDVLIAGYMCYFLSRLEPGFKSTQAVLSRILQVTIGTGALTATVAICDLTLFLAGYRSGSLFMAPCAVLGKLYSNSMMVLFNSRMNITRGRNSVPMTEIMLDSVLLSRTEGPRTAISGIQFRTHDTEVDSGLSTPYTSENKAVPEESDESA